MNLITIKYTELFSLSIEQPFYENNYCKKFNLEPVLDFELIPSIDCARTMNRLDYLCKFRSENSGLAVLSRVHGKNGNDHNLLRFKPIAGDKLCFWMVLKNSAVMNFNELPISIDKSRIFYFSNQITDAGALRSNLHLTGSADGVSESNDTEVKMGADYQFNHDSNVTPNSAVVKHSLSGIELVAKTIVNHINSADIYFNLNPLPQGQCKLFINHIEEDSFYYMGMDAPKNVFGVIEFILDNSLDTNYRIVEPDKSLTPERPFYSVHFKNRLTLWRYTVELTKNSPLFIEMNALPDQTSINNFINRLNIITNDTDVTFAQTSASPDRTSFQFVSNKPLALQEKYISSSSVTKETLSLTLKKNVGIPAETEIKSDLQCPSTGSINAIDNPTIYSDILLTI